MRRTVTTQDLGAELATVTMAVIPTQEKSGPSTCPADPPGRSMCLSMCLLNRPLNNRELATWDAKNERVDAEAESQHIHVVTMHGRLVLWSRQSRHMQEKGDQEQDRADEAEVIFLPCKSRKSSQCQRRS